MTCWELQVLKVGINPICHCILLLQMRDLGPQSVCGWELGSIGW